MARALSSSSPRAFLRVLLLAASATAIACGSTGDAESGSEDAITSNDGKVVELRFQGEVVGRKDDTARKAIASQLQYLNGILTTDVRGNAQAAMPVLSNVRETVDGDKKRITYEAAVAAVWPKRSEPPASYELTLPRDTTALASFNAKYDGRCGVNEYGRETFWHDFNPKAPGCTIDAGDVVTATASVAPHSQLTQDKYPEYDQVWSDDALDVVAVFGIISSNTPSDEGARTREKLLAEVQASLDTSERTEAPATRGVLAESTVRGTKTIDGRARTVNVTAFLVQEASSAGSAFDERYEAATATADLVVYEGHSGLGQNINALARHTGATAGKYQLVYFYGCQTLAYLEPTMLERRITLNGEARDPEGTKFLDVIATALPAYGDGGRSTLGLYRALLEPAAPKTFNQLIDGISSLHLVTVFGEHDNTFEP